MYSFIQLHHLDVIFETIPPRCQGGKFLSSFIRYLLCAMNKGHFKFFIIVSAMLGLSHLLTLPLPYAPKMISGLPVCVLRKSMVVDSAFPLRPTNSITRIHRIRRMLEHVEKLSFSCVNILSIVPSETGQTSKYSLMPKCCAPFPF